MNCYRSVFFDVKIFLFTAFSLIFIATESNSQTYLIPYRENDQWGFADTNGHILVKPKYDEVSFFFRGYAQVKKGGLTGLINTRGREIILPIYDEIKSHYFDYPEVVKDGKAGIVRVTDGKVVLPTEYKEARMVTRNFFIVTRLNGSQSFYNAGLQKWPLAESYDRIDYIGGNGGEEYFLAIRKADTVGFSISKNEVFRNGMRMQQIVPDRVIADEAISSGEEQIPEQEMIISKDGVAAQFSEFSWQQQSGGKWGWLYWKKVNGVEVENRIIPPVYDTIYSVLPQTNQFLRPGIGSFFIVAKNGRKGVIDLNNEIIIPLKYDDLISYDSSVSHGVYIAKSNGNYGLTTAEGTLLPFEYDGISWINSEIKRFVLHSNGKSGLYFYDLQHGTAGVLIPPVYDYIISITGVRPADFDRSLEYDFKTNAGVMSLIWVSKNGKKGYVDLKGREYFK